MSNVPTVAGRNDPPKGLDVYARSRAHELSRQDPKFDYQYVSRDPKHPQFVGNYLKPREIGNPIAGYVMLDPWEVVHEGETEQQGRKRADDGKPVDTTMTHGSMIMVRTPKANAEKARLMNDRITEKQSAAMSDGERSRTETVLYGAKVYHGNGESGALAQNVVSAQLTGGK